MLESKRSETNMLVLLSNIPKFVRALAVLKQVCYWFDWWKINWVFIWFKSFVFITVWFQRLIWDTLLLLKIFNLNISDIFKQFEDHVFWGSLIFYRINSQQFNEIGVEMIGCLLVCLSSKNTNCYMVPIISDMRVSVVYGRKYH